MTRLVVTRFAYLGMMIMMMILMMIMMTKPYDYDDDTDDDNDYKNNSYTAPGARTKQRASTSSSIAINLMTIIISMVI